MQIEEIQKLKLSCLELATKTAIQESVSALELAKSYFDWVNGAILSTAQEQQSEE